MEPREFDVGTWHWEAEGYGYGACSRSLLTTKSRQGGQSRGPKGLELEHDPAIMQVWVGILLDHGD